MMLETFENKTWKKEKSNESHSIACDNDDDDDDDSE